MLVSIRTPYKGDNKYQSAASELFGQTEQRMGENRGSEDISNNGLRGNNMGSDIEASQHLLLEERGFNGTQISETSNVPKEAKRSTPQHPKNRKKKGFGTRPKRQSPKKV
ncbi:hypothetical protein KIN20_021514 [Parelaphostrongylus tenuis]|uniref:Uncharacterized protein n=1 Tax=Parelaphostrongylus tenuis TaxID=148309 RepID=A0AAD5QU84_PARTN|nr:hypothetical protein KIN20_021514 [Parelaphostrongylus tenuis]